MNRNQVLQQYRKQFIEEGFSERDSVQLSYIYYRQEHCNFAIRNENNIVDLENTMALISEEQEDVSGDYAHILGAGDKPSKSNKFDGLKPRGIIITDTYNDPLFPLPEPKIDTSKLNLIKVLKQFKDYYSKFQLVYSAWHFIVEMVNMKYYAFNTRPLDMRFPLTTDRALGIIKKNKTSLNGESLKFFKERPFDLSQAVHIKIIGDSSSDVYTKSFYELIGRTCIGPILRMFKLPTIYGQRVTSLNLGKKFNTSMLDQYMKN